jgi:hypothetical protein
MSTTLKLKEQAFVVFKESCKTHDFSAFVTGN